VHAEVAHAALEQRRADGVGHGADADLQAVAVRDLRGNQPADRDVGRARERVGQLRGRLAAAVDHVVHLAHVDAGLLAVDVRQAGARLDDDRLRALDDRAVPQVGCAQVEVAVLVDRAGLEDDDVDGRDEAAVVVRDLAEVHRQVAAAAGVVLFPVAAGEVQAHRVHVTAVGVRLMDCRRTHRQAVADLEVRDLVDPRRERPIEHVGLADAGAEVEPHARRDERRRLSGGDRPRPGGGRAQVHGRPHPSRKPVRRQARRRQRMCRWDQSGPAVLTRGRRADRGDAIARPSPAPRGRRRP
jgi:hypothetical protein